MKNNKTPISTDYILQAIRMKIVRFSVSCRESMVQDLIGLVSEYPSRCLADDTNNIVPNNTSAMQYLSFPNLLRSSVTLMKGLTDCFWGDS